MLIPSHWVAGLHADDAEGRQISKDVRTESGGQKALVPLQDSLASICGKRKHRNSA